MAKSVNNFNFHWFCLGEGMGCAVKCGSWGLGEGKGVFGGEGSSKGTQADPSCEPSPLFMSLLNRGLGNTGFSLSEWSSAAGLLWSRFAINEAAPGPAQCSGFLLPWPLLSTSRRALPAPLFSTPLLAGPGTAAWHLDTWKWLEESQELCCAAEEPCFVSLRAGEGTGGGGWREAPRVSALPLGLRCSLPPVAASPAFPRPSGSPRRGVCLRGRPWGSAFPGYRGRGARGGEGGARRPDPRGGDSPGGGAWAGSAPRDAIAEAGTARVSTGAAAAMEFPDLGAHCSWSPCQRLGEPGGTGVLGGRGSGRSGSAPARARQPQVWACAARTGRQGRGRAPSWCGGR